jgi:hypothetical protein
MPRSDRIDYWLAALNSNVERGVFLTKRDLDAVVEDGEDLENVLDARIQKAMFTLVKTRFDANPELNRRFKETADIKLLQQLLTLARVKELTRVRIVRKRGATNVRYDVRELARTFFGERILAGLGYKREILSQIEYDELTQEFGKIKLSLPISEQTSAGEPTVFISYSTRDTKTADTICDGLEAQGIRCWIAPRDIEPGTQWADSISAAIADAMVMIVVFSKHANDSKQVKRELTLADSAGLTIIPFRIDESPLSGAFEYYFSACHWLDASKPPLHSHIARLTEILSDKVPCSI